MSRTNPDPTVPHLTGSYETGIHRNLFAETLGVTDQEIDRRLEGAWGHFFEGDDDNERLVYADSTGSYVVDINNNDIRSEGMSYGMMIAVQLDRQAEFDRIWKWTKTHMFHQTGELAGFFAWHCRRDGTRISQGPAPDGEEWFVMALLFAANRWGKNDGGLDYQREADAILEVMLHKSEEGHEDVISMFCRDARQVRFVPTRPWAGTTDPSYHLPAFYELWGRWARRDRDFWLKAATTSREFFHRTAHPETGLMPDYAYFDGVPCAHKGHGDFRFDAFRTLANVALDHAWFAADPWQIEQSNRVLRFLEQFGESPPNQFALDGTPLSKSSSPGLTAMAAVAGLAADRELAEPWVRRLWEAPLPTGNSRYYDGLLIFLALLQVSGRFSIIRPDESA